MSATDDMLGALERAGKKPKPAGQDRWMAQCPAHPDGRPSLSIRKGRGGVLLFCFAGCEATAIANEVGLTVDDLFDNRKGIDYEYRRGGQLLRTVHRSPSKTFSQTVVTGDVTLYMPPGIEEAMPEVLSIGVDIYIPEGEKDADTLALEGFIAVAAPMGAANWAKADYSVLRGKSTFYICADNDEIGLARAEGLRVHLEQYSTKPVHVLRSPIGKDVTDCLVAGYKMSDMIEVEAPPAPNDPLFDQGVADQLFRWRVTEEAKRIQAQERSLPGDKLNPRTLGSILDMAFTYDWVIPDLLERQDRLILTGMEGHGKSHLLRQIVICAAAGLDPFTTHGIDPVRCLVIDAENSEQQWNRAAQYITGRAGSIGTADPRKGVMVAAGIRLDFTRPADLNEVHRLVDEHRPDILYIGPLYKLMPKEVTTDDDAAPLILALDGLRERGLTLLMEAHAGHAKGSGGERDLRPRGSSALMGWPEFGMGLRRLEEDDTVAQLVKWRGDREERNWPKLIRKGIEGELPWTAVDGTEGY